MKFKLLLILVPFCINGLAQNKTIEAVELEFQTKELKVNELLYFQAPDSIQSKQILDIETRLNIEINSLEATSHVYTNSELFKLTSRDTDALILWSEELAVWFFGQEIYFQFLFPVGFGPGGTLLEREVGSRNVSFIIMNSGCEVSFSDPLEKELVIYAVFHLKMKELLER
ncbi:hypothetical protein [Gilvibacter sp.]|jgi:hypothetical protein|uniref:hypothetical protein n=1 Tax=Gilvibacter sp. TaxID=2729997 RepID=UPI003B51DF52